LTFLSTYLDAVWLSIGVRSLANLGIAALQTSGRTIIQNLIGGVIISMTLQSVNSKIVLLVFI